MQGIAYWIEKRAYLHPDRIAIITEEEEMTYKQLHEYVSKVAAYLIYDLNMQKGERIAILSQNSLEYIVLLFAIAKVECIAVPLNIRLTENELIFQLKDSGTTVLFVEETFQNMALSMHNVSYVQRVILIKSLKEIEDRKSDHFEEKMKAHPLLYVIHQVQQENRKEPYLHKKICFGMRLTIHLRLT